MKVRPDKFGRFVLRCVVTDNGKVVEVLEQAVRPDEFEKSIRRKHFSSRLVGALSTGRKIEFYLKGTQ